MMTLRPFRTRDAAYYWAYGLTLVPSSDGGWWALGGRSTPTGPELFSIGLGPDGRATSATGWPTEVRGRYVWAIPDGGSWLPCVCEAPDCLAAWLLEESQR